jgi:hypothetical protein
MYLNTLQYCFCSIVVFKLFVAVLIYRTKPAMVILMDGKKFGAALLQTRVVCSLSQKGGWTPPADPPDNIFVAAGGVYPLFCEELQTLWFAAVLHQIFFLMDMSARMSSRLTKPPYDSDGNSHSPPLLILTIITCN